MRLALALLACVGCRQIFGIDTDVKLDGSTTNGDGGGDSIDAPACMFRDVSTSRFFTCAIDPQGGVWCWGFFAGTRTLDPTQVTLPGPAVQVAAGKDHVCVRLETGNVHCWGSNGSGQLGTGTTSMQPITTPVQAQLGGQRALELASGGYHSCIRRDSDSGIVCWGLNDKFQTGQTSGGSTPTPTLVAGTEGTQKLAVGHNHNCIVDSMGLTRCWGRNTNQNNPPLVIVEGQLGDAGGDRAQPTQVIGVTAGSVTALGAGGKNSCVVEAGGTVKCWGDGGEGQLGRGQFMPGASAPGLALINGVSAIAPGSFGACALLADGGVACWGQVDAGANKAHELSPTPIMSSVTNAVQLSVKNLHACARTTSGLLCWGDNADGQLGRGTRSFSDTPVAVSLPGSATMVTAAFSRACAVTGSGLSCWGGPPIGDGTYVSAVSPKSITTGLSSVAGVTIARGLICAWGGGGARCWGGNSEGQVGNGTTIDTIAPVAVENSTGTALTNVTKIAAGGVHACAIVNGGVMCWGRNLHGQLGNSTTTSSSFAVAAGTLTGVTDVMTAGFPQPTRGGHSCAIASGAIHCWGDNPSGQLGDGTQTDRSSPNAASGGITDWVQLSGGIGFTCARRTTNGEVHCWGANQNGELGVGDTMTHRAPPSKVQLPSAAAWLSNKCAGLTNGKVYCWGSGTILGTSTAGMVPVEVPALDGIDQYTTGCLLDGGAVSCWGNQSLLGNGDLSTSMPAAPNVPCTP
jgi:alpha-tubulin suppressor-like RCC1 family protein